MFFASYNFARFLYLEKYEIIETAIADSYSLKTVSIPKSGVHYKVETEYRLNGEDTKQICSFDFKPSNEYIEHEKIQITTDYKKDFKLPLNKKNHFKKIK